MAVLLTAVRIDSDRRLWQNPQTSVATLGFAIPEATDVCGKRTDVCDIPGSKNEHILMPFRPRIDPGSPRDFL